MTSAVSFWMLSWRTWLREAALALALRSCSSACSARYFFGFELGHFSTSFLECHGVGRGSNRNNILSHLLPFERHIRVVVGFLLILRKLETTEIILQLLVGLDLYCSICSRPPLPTSSRISTRTSWATSSARSIRQCRVKQMVQVHKQMVQVPDGEFELRLFQVLECPPHSLVRDGQTSPHRPRLVVPRSTCPPLFPPAWPSLQASTRQPSLLA